MWEMKRCLPLSAFACAAFALACSSSDKSPGAIANCFGATCTPGGEVGQNPEKEAGADSSTDASKLELKGTLLQVTDDRFVTGTTFTGAATVSVPTPTGSSDIAMGGDAGLTQFTVSDALTGWNWFFASPKSSVDVLPTWSYLYVDSGSNTNFKVPLMDRTVLDSIYGSASTPVAMSTTTAQLVVIFYTDYASDKRASGVQITKNPFTATAVLYDIGGGYAMETAVDGGTLKTGSWGTVIFQNVTAGVGAISYKVGDTTHVTPNPLNVVPGAVSLVHVAVPE